MKPVPWLSRIRSLHPKSRRLHLLSSPSDAFWSRLFRNTGAPRHQNSSEGVSERTHGSIFIPSDPLFCFSHFPDVSSNVGRSVGQEAPPPRGAGWSWVAGKGRPLSLCSLSAVGLDCSEDICTFALNRACLDEGSLRSPPPL